MKHIIRSFEKEPIITLMPDVTYSQVPYWFDSTMMPLKMDLLLPRHKQVTAPQPAIVWICGGAYQQIDRHVWTAEMVWYAKRGYTVAVVDYRNSMEAQWPAQIIDIKTAIRFLRAHAAAFCIDPARIAVMGESAGGHLAILAGTAAGVPEFEGTEYPEQSSAVQAVVDFYGIAEMNTMGGEDSINNGDPQALLFGCTCAQDPEKYAAASPIRYVNEKCPPFLILHGDRDPLVPIQQSEHLYDALEKAGVPVEMDIYEGVGHGTDEFYQEAARQRIDAFLSRYLK